MDEELEKFIAEIMKEVQGRVDFTKNQVETIFLLAKFLIKNKFDHVPLAVVCRYNKDGTTDKGLFLVSPRRGNK